MSRKRLSWSKKADPYTMNQERDLPAGEDYWIGGPSEFAETPHPELPDDEALGRNEIGQPNMAVKSYNSRQADYWDDAPAPRKAGQRVRRVEAQRDLYSSLKKKAFQCVKIAAALLPTASEEAIEEQAFEFMALPDDVVISTAIRLAEEKDEDAEEMEEGEDKKDKDKKEKKDKKSFLSPDEMLREMLAEGHDGDDDEEVAHYDDHEDDAKDAAKAGEDHDDDHDEEDMDDDKESAEIGRMLSDMMGGSARQSEVDDSYGIQLEPTMNNVDAGDYGIEENELLQNLFNNTIPEEARNASQEPQSKQASRRRTAGEGVQSLGGRVNTPNKDGEEFDLASLWRSAPDMSKVNE